MYLSTCGASELLAHVVKFELPFSGFMKAVNGDSYIILSLNKALTT